MKAIFSLLLILVLVSLADAAMTCKRVTASSQSCTANVSWPASVVDATHDAPTTYIVQRRDGLTAAFVTITTVPSSQLAFADTFVDAGSVPHCWQILAANAGGQSGPAPMGCQTSPAIQVQPPNAPAITNVAALSNSELQITLKDNSDNELGFQVEQSSGPSGTKVWEMDANQTVLLTTGLRSNTWYEQRARALGENANSAWSAKVKTKTLK
jgi:hypothetical protein